MTTWKLVPVEPTGEMLAEIEANRNNPRWAWETALAVAPEPDDEVVERVARAIQIAPYRTDEFGNLTDASYIDLARAALKALGSGDD